MTVVCVVKPLTNNPGAKLRLRLDKNLAEIPRISRSIVGLFGRWRGTIAAIPEGGRSRGMAYITLSAVFFFSLSLLRHRKHELIIAITNNTTHPNECTVVRPDQPRPARPCPLRSNAPEDSSSGRRVEGRCHRDPDWTLASGQSASGDELDAMGRNHQ